MNRKRSISLSICDFFFFDPHKKRADFPVSERKLDSPDRGSKSFEARKPRGTDRSALENSPNSGREYKRETRQL